MADAAAVLATAPTRLSRATASRKHDKISRRTAVAPAAAIAEASDVGRQGAVDGEEYIPSSALELPPGAAATLADAAAVLAMAPARVLTSYHSNNALSTTHPGEDLGAVAVARRLRRRCMRRRAGAPGAVSAVPPRSRRRGVRPPLPRRRLALGARSTWCSTAPAQVEPNRSVAKTVRHARSQGSGHRARGAERFGTEQGLRLSRAAASAAA